MKKAVGVWIERAERFHEIAMGWKPLNGTFVVIGEAGSGVVENPFVETTLSGKEAA